MILPGATLGVMGGGQLGRMFALEALRMGYRVVVFDPDKNSPAGQIAHQHLCAAYDDRSALDEMLQACDAITIEFENLPIDSLVYLESKGQLSPPSSAVRIAQDRLLEKNFFRDHGLATPRFHIIESDADVTAAVAETGLPAIIKTARFGYDGKGQAVCESEEAVREAFAALGGVTCILEQRIALKTEISVVLARSAAGVVTPFPLAENTHTNGILDVTVVPAAVDETLRNTALDLATRLADALAYVGVLAVELFVSEQGEVLLNEIAPRPHNSGHFTQDATITSQFGQQVRMMCDLPAGSPDLRCPVVMLNLLGDLWGDSQPDWAAVLAEPGASLHLYGKAEARAGRKMGHINFLGADTAALKAAALAFKSRLDRRKS
ncbi:5-(carboxyamino)imidazole ribonucleotide synthase [Granulosicoccaceae sp. 1_MG-2023]|nr:5-(carboxyamino)imidazole ribonucleotide synthase [Granulosicoccaceae sp. 1_MG-2023]